MASGFVFNARRTEPGPRVTVFAHRDRCLVRWVCEVRIGGRQRRQGFKTREEAVEKGAEVIASGDPAAWINAARQTTEKATDWKKTHKPVKVVPGWRGRKMLGGYSK